MNHEKLESFRNSDSTLQTKGEQTETNYLEGKSEDEKYRKEVEK